MSRPAFPPHTLVAALPVDLLDESPDNDNPNQMSDEDFRGLVEAISRLDFAQALTVMKSGERYRVVDGVHRKRAAVLAGRETLPALVYEPMEEAQFRALRLALNRWRGDPRASAVHADVLFLHEAGWDAALLHASAGLPQEELDAILNLAPIPTGSEGGDLTLPDPDAGSLGNGTTPSGSELLSTSPIIEIACSSPASKEELVRLLKRAGKGAKARGKFKLEATLRAALLAYTGED